MKRLLVILLLVPQLTWGAMDFNGSTGKATASAVEVSAAPMSISCWGNSDSATASQTAVSISDTATDVQNLYVNWGGTAIGDPIRVVSDSTSAGVASSSSGYTISTWHHSAGVWTSSASRAAFIDGGSKGTETTDLSPSSLDTTGIGVLARLNQGGFFDGRLAECGIWNVALTDDEVATLARGFAPPCVRRASLLAYYPMIRDTTTLKDLFSATANNLTLAGTTAVADHPRVINCQ